jgi:serine/threonine protein phosphatase PrpC
MHPAEDAYVLDLASGVGAVCDGLGGHGHGDIASTIARDCITAQLPPGDDDRWPLIAAHVCRTALVAARGERNEWRRMTSTLTLARVWPDGRYELAWCGDSRAYQLRADWRLVPLTEDHDLLYDQVQKGLITPVKAAGVRAALADVESSGEAWRAAGGLGKRTYRSRNQMVSELSSGPIDYLTGRLGNGDVLVLCTDGVHDNLTLTGMQAIAAHDADPTTLSHALADAAFERACAQDGHAHPDDITCLTLAL